jgi:predicted nucleic acid-binding protein
VDYEFGNICWKRVKRGELKEIEAIEIIQNYQKINLNKIDIDNFIPNILALAIDTQTTFYDCSYLILATELNTKFITADDSFAKQMQNYFPKQIVSLRTVEITY